MISIIKLSIGLLILSIQSASYILNYRSYKTKNTRTSGTRSQRLQCFSTNINKEDETVQVFDNVFSSFACEELSYLAENHSSRGNDGSSIFTRPPLNERPLTPIENAIDSFLSSIGDTTSLVEYWSRDEHINIDTHADIDEVQLMDENVIRCPKMAHVLYLQVEDDLRGPTCVFLDKRKGWGSKEDEISPTDYKSSIDLVVTPAINGRVLRFPGDSMHAVPCPADRWFLNIDEQNDLVKESVDEDSDNDDYDDEFRERSVILFNTWSEAGPKGVNGDYMNGSLPEGIELSEDDTFSFLQTEESRILSEWDEEYGINAEKIRCNQPEDWELIDIVIQNQEFKEQLSVVSVQLMGNKNRRLHKGKFVTLLGPSNSLQQALLNEKQPSSIKLHESFF